MNPRGYLARAAAAVVVLVPVTAWAQPLLAGIDANIGASEVVGGGIALGSSYALVSRLLTLVEKLVADRLGLKVPTDSKAAAGALVEVIASDRDAVLTAAKQVAEMYKVIAAREGPDEGLARLQHERHVRASLETLTHSQADLARAQAEASRQTEASAADVRQLTEAVRALTSELRAERIGRAG